MDRGVKTGNLDAQLAVFQCLAFTVARRRLISNGEQSPTHPAIDKTARNRLQAVEFGASHRLEKHADPNLDSKKHSTQ
jgi:hypothetical protein